MKLALCAIAVSMLLVPWPPQERTAAAILRDMRQALGGDAALADVKSVSLEAAGQMSIKGTSMDVADDYFMVWPDHFMRVRRLVGMSRFASVSDMKMYQGCRGDVVIRSGGRRSTPPTVTPTGDRLALAKCRHDAARLALALTGTSIPVFPLEFSVSGVEEAGGERYEIVAAQGPDSVRLQLYVEAKTHLPAMVVSNGLERTPELKWFLSDFKRTGAFVWPRRIEEQAEGLTETLTIKAWKVNPRIDARTFEPR